MTNGNTPDNSSTDLSIVDPASQDPVHLASVDVKQSGAHLGGGIYFSANHYPSFGGTNAARPQRSLEDEAEVHDTVEIDYTLPPIAPGGEDAWLPFMKDIDEDARPDVLLAGFDMSLHVGARLSDGAFYDGPSVPLLIAADPGDLSGDIVVTGYPARSTSLGDRSGVLHQVTGSLSQQGYTRQEVNGITGGYFTIDDAAPVGGMSGGGTFLSYDVDGDGTKEVYLIGAVSEVETDVDPETGEVLDIATLSTAFAPHYAALAEAIEGLSGDAARDADDFGRMVLLSGQSEGSAFTTVQGQFFHEDIYGGVNADILRGGGGDDLILGHRANDTLAGEAGNDTLEGGQGYDLLLGGAGDDYLDGKRGHDALLGGTGDDFLFGRRGKDRLEGGEGNDVASGGRGADLILGGAGDDSLNGNRGHDTLEGGEGADVLRGARGRDQLSGGEGDDVLYGNRGADTLEGGAGNDLLKGGSGRDRLNGGADDDILTGLSGADTFVFDGGADVITDLSRAHRDRIELDAIALGLQGISGADVVAQYAQMDDGATVFDFGEGNTLTVLNAGQPEVLADLIFVV